MKPQSRAAMDAERARRDAAWQRENEQRKAAGLPPANTMATHAAPGVAPPHVAVTVRPGMGVPPPQVAVQVTSASGQPVMQQPQPQPQPEYPPPPPGVTPEQWAQALAEAVTRQMMQPIDPMSNMPMPGMPPGMPGMPSMDQPPPGWTPEMAGAPVAATVQVGAAAQVLRDVGVVLSAHMRPQMTDQQLIKLRQQSVQAKRILYIVSPNVQVNESVLSTQHTARFSTPITPWWRFSIATMLDNEYVVILDDDTLPGSHWMESALDYLAKNPNDVVASRGTRLDESLGEQGVGPGSEPDQITEVDYGENGWAMKRDTLIDMLGQQMFDQNPYFGWSIHLGWAVKKTGGKTVVLPYSAQTAGMLQGPARDAVSLRRSAPWSDKHYQVVRHYRNAGWQITGAQQQ